MIGWLKNWLSNQGLSDFLAGLIVYSAAFVVMILVAWIAYRVAHKLLVAGVGFLVRRTRTQLDDVLIEHGVFDKLSLLAPSFVVYTFAPAFDSGSEWFDRLSQAYMILIALMVINAIISGYTALYESMEISRERPIKSYVQVVIIFMYLIGGILILSKLMGQSPWGILSGIGALTAIIMLIFKDSILGLVASIQLVAHDMLRKGDWVSMPKYDADGDVLDITLNTVKIQNWDKTITTIPTHAFVSDAFKNWRGMSESGGRRIKRSISIDMGSVKLCDDEHLARLAEVEALTEPVKAAQEALKSATAGPVHPARPTNITLFRGYLEALLQGHPKIHKEMTFLVRLLAPSDQGLPVEFYVFSNDQVWSNYEALQAEIVEHLLAVMPTFELRVFQQPTGHDVRAAGVDAQ